MGQGKIVRERQGPRPHVCDAQARLLAADDASSSTVVSLGALASKELVAAVLLREMRQRLASASPMSLRPQRDGDSPWR